MNVVDRCRLLYLLKSVAIRRIHHINAKMFSIELGRDGNSFSVWTPKGLLIVATLRNAPGSRTIWLQGPNLKQTAPVVGGERKHAATAVLAELAHVAAGPIEEPVEAVEPRDDLEPEREPVPAGVAVASGEMADTAALLQQPLVDFLVEDAIGVPFAQDGGLKEEGIENTSRAQQRVPHKIG